MNMNKNNKQLENTCPKTAFLGLSQKRFDQWVNIRWQKIEEYHKGKQTEILPCMIGEHSYNGQSFTLSK